MEFKLRKLLSDSCESICLSIRNNSDLAYNCLQYYSCDKVCPDFCFSSPPPPPSVSLHRTMNRTLVISLSFLAAIICFIFFSLYFKFYRRTTTNSRLGLGQQNLRPETNLTVDHHDHDDDDVSRSVVDHHVWYIRTVGLNPSIINAISVLKYNKNDGIVEGTDCSVCLSEFVEDESVRLLPKCNHAFHILCIDTWLRSHTNCPNCRAPIVMNPAPVRDDSMVRVNILPDNEESLGQQTNGEENELAIRVQEENELALDNKEDEKEDEEEEIQPMRRSVSLDSLSVSLDSLSALKISRGLTNVNSESNKSIVNSVTKAESDRHMPLPRTSMASSSSERYLQNGQAQAASLKRPITWNEKWQMSIPKRVREVAMELLKAISERLGLESNYIETAMDLNNGLQLSVSNFYLPCPQSELAMGLGPHSDHGLLTFLMQNEIGGLQVRHDGNWVNVDPLPNCFLVNTGDHMEIFRNGKYKSVLHRAMVNKESTRISIAMQGDFIGATQFTHATHKIN